LNHVFPFDRFESEVRALAQRIASGPQIAIRAIKQALFGRDQEPLTQALEREVEYQLKCFHSEDCREGIRAFHDKRPPKFEGR
jgi:2-(1,2-epoxy-1,2-dihydrophenyl)acetyl-CoA isomerase